MRGCANTTGMHDAHGEPEKGIFEFPAKWVRWRMRLRGEIFSIDNAGLTAFVEK